MWELRSAPFMCPHTLHQNVSQRLVFDHQFEPLPQLPFLRFFVSPNTKSDFPLLQAASSLSPITSMLEKDEFEAPGNMTVMDSDGFPLLFKTYTSSFSYGARSSTAQLLKARTNQFEEGVMEEIEDTFDEDVIVVDYDPKVCILSNPLFSSVDYKDDLIQLINGRLQEQHEEQTGPLYRQIVFDWKCEEVEVLVLDPIPKELRRLMLQPASKQKSDQQWTSSGSQMVSFERVFKVFPNVKDLFLRETAFNIKYCYRLEHFIKNSKSAVALERMFFSKEKRMEQTETVNARLKSIGWEFVPYEQSMMRVE